MLMMMSQTFALCALTTSCELTEEDFIHRKFTSLSLSPLPLNLCFFAAQKLALNLPPYTKQTHRKVTNHTKTFSKRFSSRLSSFFSSCHE
jgi:hypothetical protein